MTTVAMAGALGPPPWADPTPAAWLVHADRCLDADDPAGQLRALRFVVGLQKRPRLVLMCDRHGVGHAIDPRPNSPDRPDRGGRVGPHDEGWRWSQCENLRWAVTLNGCKGACGPWGNYAGYVRSTLLFTTPLDFPGMADEPDPKAGSPLREFYYKASYDVRPFRHTDGHVYYRDRKYKMIRIV